MLKKSLFAVALVAMLAGMSLAGEIKVHDWPVSWQYEYQAVTVIPVTMDIGYWLKIRDQDKLSIHMTQDAIQQYSGCTTMKVDCNFDVSLKATIAKDAAGIGGDYSCSVSPNTLVPGKNQPVDVCATLKKADLADATAKQTITTAHVTISVAPVPGSGGGGTDIPNMWGDL